MRGRSVIHQSHDLTVALDRHIVVLSAVACIGDAFVEAAIGRVAPMRVETVGGPAQAILGKQLTRGMRCDEGIAAVGAAAAIGGANDDGVLGRIGQTGHGKW